MADKSINTLPQASEIYDDSLFVVEHSSEAKSISGRQFKAYAREGVETYVESAQEAAKDALGAVASIGNSVETAKNSELAAQKSAEDAGIAAQNAADSALSSKEQADRSGDFAIQAGVEADRSGREADRAQAEADRATLPPVQGVYNIVIPDRITGSRYKLIVENGVLGILSVSAKLDAVEPVQIDPITGIAWRIIVEDGALGIEEVS